MRASCAEVAETRTELLLWMPIALTSHQRAELDETGWVVLPRVLSGAALARVSSAFDAVAEQKRAIDGVATTNNSVSWRNGLVRHPDLTDLVDHDDVLGPVVEIIGWNIQNRDSIFVYTTDGPSQHHNASGSLADRTARRAPGELHLGWHFDYEEEFNGVTLDGRMPLLDLKASWLVSDHSDARSSTTLLVRGSFRWDAEQRATWQQWLDPSCIVPVRAPAGSVLIWRPTTLHAVLPHTHPGEPRKALHVSYGPRWLRCASLALAPLPLIFSFKSEKSLCGTGSRSLIGRTATLAKRRKCSPQLQRTATCANSCSKDSAARWAR